MILSSKKKMHNTYLCKHYILFPNFIIFLIFGLDLYRLKNDFMLVDWVNYKFTIFEEYTMIIDSELLLNISCFALTQILISSNF